MDRAPGYAVNDHLTINTGMTLAGCQHLCLVDDSCHTFMYVRKSKRCVTSILPLSALKIKQDSDVDLYVPLSREAPCGGYLCPDHKCVNKTTARCDQVSDCDDLSDELDCGAELDVALRLADGGGRRNAGRLEIRVAGSWGAVCDDVFGVEEADAACRQLGFRRFRRFYANGRGYPAAEDSSRWADRPEQSTRQKQRKRNARGMG